MIPSLTNRRVVVFGLGRSGRAATTLLLARGARVIAVDRDPDTAAMEGVEMRLGGDATAVFVQAELVVVSPGIPATHPYLQAAVASGVPVVGELALAASLLSAPMVAITGTNGKSTVTSFTAQLLAAAGYRPFAGGNLGRPLSDAVGGDADVLVVEVSSYQLEWPAGLHPRVATVLNLTPDHLARHGDMRGYAAAKARVADNMTSADLLLLPADDVRIGEHVTGSPQRLAIGAAPGVTRDGDRAVLVWGGGTVPMDLSRLAVPGEHNRDNAAVAASMAIAVGADPGRVVAAIGRLTALAHRMEVVGEAAGVLWINDSKATNLEAAQVGIAGLDRPAVVLLGGEAKGPGFAGLVPSLARHRAVVTFGGDGPMIADELGAAGVSVVRAGTLEQALAMAAQLARSGDAVLLSPGCASFDAFDNFEVRGDVFRRWVQRFSFQESAP